MLYMTLSSQDKRKEFLDDTFFYSVHTFARIRQHYFSKHWGTDAWTVPPPQIWGERPPRPTRSPPLAWRHELDEFNIVLERNRDVMPRQEFAAD